MTAPEPRFYNRTRHSESLSWALLRKGRVLALPLYAALRRSDLAREGFEHSGSHRFADHIYRGQPSGRGWFGTWLDGRLLALPAVHSFRSRFYAARDELSAFLQARAGTPGNLHVLSAPCGIPRELVEGRRAFAASGRPSVAKVTFHGLDLDAAVLAEAEQFARAGGAEPFVPHHGDVFARDSYPEAVDFITCTGLAEFLDDERLAELYRISLTAWRPAASSSQAACAVGRWRTICSGSRKSRFTTARRRISNGSRASCRSKRCGRAWTSSGFSPSSWPSDERPPLPSRWTAGHALEPRMTSR